MNDILLINDADNTLFQITSIVGTTDFDKIRPSIWVAQNFEISRILGKNLYERILNDFSNDSLSDVYQEIYSNHVTKILIFAAVGDFIMKNSIMISNGGNFKHQATNAVVADSKETERISKYYRDMAAHCEQDFYKFMQGVNIPEYINKPSIDGGFNFNWVF